MKINVLHGLSRLLPICPPMLGRSGCVDAAVIVPFVEIGDDLHLLFQQRAAHIPQGLEVCFPGGEFDGEKDCSLRETALRETVEELGIGSDAIDIIGQLGTVATLRGIAVDCFIAHLNIGSPESLSIDRKEVERIFTLPVDWFMDHPPKRYPIRVEMHPERVADDGTITTLFPAQDLGLPKRYYRPWFVKDHEVPVYQTAEGTIWGMTAVVIAELVMWLKK